MTLEELMKAKGFTDAEIREHAPMLKNAKFRQALEAELGQVSTLRTERDALQKDVADMNKWYEETALPGTQKALDAKIAAERTAAVARGEAEAAKAEIKALQDAGLYKVAKQQGADPPSPVNHPDPDNPADPGNGNPAFDPNKYVSREDFDTVYSRVGESIAMVGDILDDHRDLFGQRLPGGMGQLRKDYAAAIRNREISSELNIRDYWERKFKVEDRRSELAAEERQKAEEQIRKDEREKVLSEVGNPMTRTAIPSQHSFVIRKKQNEDGTDVLPWQSSKGERRSARLKKATQLAAQRAAGDS